MRESGQQDADRRPRVTRSGIPIHVPEDFEGMRRAGRLAAETLDMIGNHVQPGIRTDELDVLCKEFMEKTRRRSCNARLSGLPEVFVHLDQSRGVPRHSVRKTVAGTATSSTST